VSILFFQIHVLEKKNNKLIPWKTLFQVFKVEPNMTFFVKDPRDKDISFGQGEEISCTVICTATDDDGTIKEFVAGLIQNKA